MHLRETWHIAESIGALGDVIDSFRSLRPGARLLLGPVTLRPRVNAVATRMEMVDRHDSTGYGAHHVPGADDPRQATEWAAAWAGAVLLAAAQGGTDSVTLLELAGHRGLQGPDGELTPAGRLITHMASLHRSPALIASGFAGAGSAIAQIGDHLLIVNSRLDEWSLHLPSATLQAPDSEHPRALRVAPASHHLIPLSSSARPSYSPHHPVAAAPDNS